MCGKDCRFPGTRLGPSQIAIRKSLIISYLGKHRTVHLGQHSGEARARLWACEFHQQLRPPAWARSHRHLPCQSATALWSSSRRHPRCPLPDRLSRDLRQRKKPRMVRQANRRASKLMHKPLRSKHRTPPQAQRSPLPFNPNPSLLLSRKVRTIQIAQRSNHPRLRLGRVGLRRRV
jgi:hypothetical protein